VKIEYPFTVFRNAANRPRLVESAVLFLDLLGTDVPRTPAQAAEHLRLTHEALERAREWGNSAHGANDISVASWFSDNLGLAYPISEPVEADVALGMLLSDCAFHQLAMIHSGFVARGAITVGPFYADPNFIYGPALNRAVALEKAANYPRVVLDERAAAEARCALIELERGRAGAPQRLALAVAPDGAIFVNYLASLEFQEDELFDSLQYLGRQRSVIAGNLAKYADHARVYAKYHWLASYHDWFLTQLGDDPAFARLSLSPPQPAEGFKRFGDDVPVAG
jgi:hypothetical protein